MIIFVEWMRDTRIQLTNKRQYNKSNKFKQTRREEKEEGKRMQQIKIKPTISEMKDD